jgi:HlyD family secretion protein
LTVPNAALRFRPENAGPAQASAGNAGGGGMRRRAEGGGGQGGVGPGENGGSWRRDRGGDNEEGGPLAPAKRTVYVLQAGKPVPREVTPGITDGRVTEILSGEVKEGDDVIVSIAGQNPNQQRGGQGQGQRGFRIL